MNENDPSAATHHSQYDALWKYLTEQAMQNEATAEALRLAEQKYRSIFEHATEGIFQTTPDGRYLSANPTLARIYGYASPDELITGLTNISRQLYLLPGRRDEFIRLMRTDGLVREFESEVYRRDGSIIWILENARAVRDELSGALLYYEGMVQDITARKLAEEARAQADARKLAQYEVTRVLAQSNRLREAARKIMQSICECIGWDFGDLWSIDPVARVLQCVDLWHAPEIEVPEFVAITRRITFASGIGLPGRVWSSRKIFWIPDVVEDSNFPRAAMAARSGLHSGIAFPIFLADEVIGVMEFFSRDIHLPDDDLLAMFAALGTQIGQFIERERIADQLARYAEDLRAKNAQLEADLEMARDVQQVFLTQKHPTFPRGVEPQESWVRFCQCYKPAERVGGDFFSMLPLSDTEVGVFICDVVGHGLQAALVTAIVRGLVEELTPIAADAGRFLTELNRGLLAIFRQTETPMMASAFYLVVNVAAGELRYAHAGHPNPLHVRRHAGTVEPFRFEESHGPVLGVFEHAEYRTARRPIAPGDLIMLFTDGLFEVEVAPDDYYGEQRLATAVRERLRLPAEELFAQVIAEIQERCVDQEFTDDVCLLGVEVVRTGPANQPRLVA
ncbi:MAG: phosphoserine phosphatase RsbU/P [Chthoniobacter sp.]|jgi:PAS domain S-box-containing protein|nr:phosphoserine phosphatase RsbU/P [Chthoniobacter sp.]